MGSTTDYARVYGPWVHSVTHGVDGLSYCADFVSILEADTLLAAIDAAPWLADLHRRVQHYGHRYDYRTRAIDTTAALGPLPDWLMPLATRLVTAGYFEAQPDQVIVNEYLPGQGIGAHIDTLSCFGPLVASLSLGSATVMDLTSPASAVPVVLQPRSLVVLTGPARTDWKHGIAARDADTIDGVLVPRARRVSITFRTRLAW